MKKVSLVLALVMLFSVLGGAALAEGEREKVEFWYLWSGIEAEMLEDTIASYNASQDKYEVIGLSVPDESKIKVSYGSGDGPDITDSFSSAVSTYYDQGILMNLNEYIEAANYDLSVFPDAMIDCCTVDGNVVALPINVMNYMMYYNVDMFKDAGLEPPTTIDELLDIAEKMTVMNGDTMEVLGFPVYPYAYYLDAAVYACGGSYTQDGETLNVDNEGFRKAVEILKAYYDKYGYDTISAFQTAGSWLDATDPFINGKQALRYDGSWLVDFINNYAPDLNYEALPIPTMTADDASVAVISSSIFYIPYSAKCPDGAFDFMAYLVGPEGAKGFLTASCNVPAHAGLYADPDMAAIKCFPEFFAAIEGGTAVLPTFPNWSQCSSLISDAVEQVVVGNFTVDQCVEYIMTEYENLY